MRRQFAAVAGIAAISLLIVSSSALARVGERTLRETYPVATTLCARAHTGTLPRRLAGQQTAVITACDALENPYSGLVSTVDAAESSFLNTVAAQRSLVAAVCTRPVSDRQACISARATARTTVASARATRVSAVATFRAAVRANRATFWSAIASLRAAAAG
jgi:hypothetical protein